MVSSRELREYYGLPKDLADDIVQAHESRNIHEIKKIVQEYGLNDDIVNRFKTYYDKVGI